MKLHFVLPMFLSVVYFYQNFLLVTDCEDRKGGGGDAYV